VCVEINKCATDLKTGDTGSDKYGCIVVDVVVTTAKKATSDGKSGLAGDRPTSARQAGVATACIDAVAESAGGLLCWRIDRTSDAGSPPRAVWNL